ncbi:DNA/RNA helicase [Virgibacillus phasianinus]|uniref:DNA/RNA helicase n=1 Tax=Virgibacillus phasianinus TaxID=2017483 RepID=A0A220U4G6_9BACI|nr:DEAD/DEAH box helicase family protein [Virgibacillus phasianinus]ASK62721.1 DNA/RNA helicase [Virgibacillus phasianinus]
MNELTPFDPHSELTLALRYSGKLLLRKEIPLDHATFQQLLNQQQFIPHASIIRKFSGPKCNRCNNQKRSLFGIIPCQICRKQHLYCRKCIEMGRVLECESLYSWQGSKPDWLSHANPCSWIGELTKRQKLASERIVEAVTNLEKELLIWAVCGAGKTEMLYAGITSALKKGKRVCLATPRADVVRELLPRFRQAFSSVHIQGLYGGSKDNDGTAQLILATTHQLLRFQAAFDLMIIDEVDAFPFHADPSLPYATSRAKNETSTTIYLTATPRKMHRKRIARNNLAHIFVPVRFHGHPLPVPTMKMSLNLRKSIQRFLPPNHFFTWLKNRRTPSRQLLLFVPTINLAERMGEKLIEKLLISEDITSELDLVTVHASDVNREEKVMQFRNKEILILITTTILERGVTFPSVDVAVIDAGHEVFDEAALVQISGRAGRSIDDPDGEVVFFHDGKTDAMVKAIRSIKSMNRRGGFK